MKKLLLFIVLIFCIGIQAQTLTKSEYDNYTVYNYQLTTFGSDSGGTVYSPWITTAGILHSDLTNNPLTLGYAGYLSYAANQTSLYTIKIQGRMTTGYTSNNATVATIVTNYVGRYDTLSLTTTTLTNYHPDQIRFAITGAGNNSGQNRVRIWLTLPKFKNYIVK
jgi:hypothetical protein